MKHYILKNLAIWLAESILTHNLRTRILPDMGLVVKYYNIRFHFRLFLGKTKDTIFQKIQKTLFWGPFSALFSRFWQKSFFLENFFKFSQKNRFLTIPVICHHAKNQKKLVSHSWEKSWTNRWTDRWTDRRTDNDDFIRPSIWWGSKK